MEERFVVFGINDLKYAISINLVNEITNACKISPIPNNSQIIEGVVNLRGDVIPVINLRKSLNIHQTFPQDHQIIIVNSEYGNYGLIIDVAHDVKTFQKDQISPISEVGLINTELISAIINANGDIIQLISIDQLLNRNEDIKSEKREMILC
ncbi:chemotaxis protein CheW [Fusibacter bizertensis]|uniref:Chemotaxis protein CheW n=1 Tax=Fusibacter bizertensis TaxID=1488331 RepID=A0ABT6NF25_9FIRM|nr:chemotaxis protein CheW [Fusibacter bizertensis]MDH8679003.1 chemotaxis protein CheW [Fusibacter bizertensis]